MNTKCSKWFNDANVVGYGGCILLIRKTKVSNVKLAALFLQFFPFGYEAFRLPFWVNCEGHWFPGYGVQEEGISGHHAGFIWIFSNGWLFAFHSVWQPFSYSSINRNGEDNFYNLRKFKLLIRKISILGKMERIVWRRWRNHATLLIPQISSELTFTLCKVPSDD